MLCDVILTFVLHFADGHTEDRLKWVDRKNATEFMHPDPEVLRMLKESFGVVKIDNYKIQIVKPYDCSKGPK